MRFFHAAQRHPSMAAGAVSLRKSHDIVILSFCNIVKSQANYIIQDNFRIEKPKTVVKNQQHLFIIQFWLMFC